MAEPIVSPSFVYRAFSGAQQFTADQSPVTWSVTGGSANGTITSGGLYAAPNKEGTFTVNATNGSSEVGSATVYVVETLKLSYPLRGVPATNKKKVLVSDAEDFSRQGRVKSAGKRAYEFTIPNRTLIELQYIDDLWDRKYPALPFWFYDPARGDFKLYIFDSELKWTPVGAGKFDLSFQVREF